MAVAPEVEQAWSGPSKRVPALDAVRGVAILAVIATHSLTAMVASTGSYELPPALFRALDYGQFGVQLFFVLSGWLIFSLYWGNRSFSQAVYWSRRWARIWPLWVIFVVATFLFLGVPDSGLPWGAAIVVCAVFLGWLFPALVAVPIGGLTIQQEMGHYLLFSLFRKRGPAFLASTVTLGYVSAFAAESLIARTAEGSVAHWMLAAWLRLQLFNSWPFFLLGGAAFVTIHLWRQRGVSSIMPRRTGAVLAVGVALGLSLLSTSAQSTPGYFVLGFVVLCVGIALAGDALPIVGPTLRSIGRYSYFMYFFHFFVLRWLERLYQASDLPAEGTTSVAFNILVLGGMFVVATGASWAVGLVSWNLLEKRILAGAHRRIPSPPRSTPA